MSAPDRPEPERSNFGDFLRSRRDRLKPDEVGLSPGLRRRARGLRREEVAELAGIGVDWYVRLEQGRLGRPSAATVDALARALRLDRAEHAHLQTLALAPRRPAFERGTASDALKQIVGSLAQPAYVTGRRWDVVTWNDAAAALFSDLAGRPEAERNILLFLLTTANARRLFGTGWEREARRVAAQFRAAYDQWAGDPAFEDVLSAVRGSCPEFQGWWNAHDVAEPGSGRKRLHLEDGRLADFTCATFQTNDDPRLKLAIYSAA